MKTIDKINRETRNIAGQANIFQFKPWHVVPGAIIILLAIYGAIKLLIELGVI